MKRFSAKKILLLAGVIALVMVLIGIVLIPSTARFSRIRDQLALGERYLAEFDYESAILAYEKVLEIDPKNVEAYIGLAQAYIASGDNDTAIRLLQEGFGLTGDRRLEEMLRAIGADIPDANGDEAPSWSREDPVVFGDPWLEGKFREWFNRPTGEFTQDDLDQIESLVIVGDDIFMINMRSLDGEEHDGYPYIESPKMIKFDLTANLPILERCPNLMELMLDSCSLEKLDGVERLEALWMLHLNRNRISDITPIFKTQNVTTVDLTDNKIRSIDGISAMSQLSGIYLTGNPVEDFSELGTMTWVWDMALEAGSEVKVDASVFAGMDSLYWLRLTGEGFTNLSGLKTAPKLVGLFITDNADEDYSFVGEMTGLEDLTLDGCGLTDISFIVGLDNLEYLSLDDNHIRDISPLAGLDKLWHVTLSGNPITDFTPVSGIESVLK